VRVVEWVDLTPVLVSAVRVRVSSGLKQRTSFGVLDRQQLLLERLERLVVLRLKVGVEVERVVAYRYFTRPRYPEPLQLL
jgi:hypothetical protein